MIKLLRVDHRLLHGQVVISWVSHLRPNCILIANDALVNDGMRKTAMRLSRPSDVKLVIKSVDDSIAALTSGKANRYDLMVIVSNVTDAARLALAVEQIDAIDLGATKPRDLTRPFSKAVSLTNEETALLAKAQEQGVDVYIQALPADRKQPFLAEKTPASPLEPWAPRGSPSAPQPTC